MTAANPRLGLSRRHLLAAPFALATASRAAQPTLPPLPPVIDLRALMTPARDQGEVRDTCAHFAFIAAAEAVLARDTGRILPLSEEFLARMARPAADPPFDESTTMVRVAAVATHHGLLPLASMPYQADTSSGCRKGGPSCRPPAAPSPQLLAQASKLKLGGIELTPGYKKFRRTMTNEHCPVIIGLKLPHDYAGWRDDGLVIAAPKVMALPAAQRDALPNHFVALSGYDDRKQMYFFKNSWGTSWGDNGYGRISYDDVFNYGVGKKFGYLIKNLVIS
jgi:hypothetical protein